MDQAAALQFDGGQTPARAHGAGRLGRIAVVAGFIAYLALLAAGWMWISKFLPNTLSVRILGHALHLKEVHHRILSNALLLLCILPSALWIELVAVGWRESSLRHLLFAASPSSRTDLACFIAGEAHLTDMAGRLMTLGLSMLSGMWIHDWLRTALGITIDPSGLPLAVQVVAYFLVYTFFDYWTHRVDHSRYFWPIHRYHHSAKDFSVVTSSRQHPAAFTGIFLINMPMAALGAPPAVMILVNVVVTTIGFLIHSRIDSDWGWIGRYLVQSPNHHRLHHILDISGGVGHFGMTPIWDHLFGTWKGDADQALVIGVDTPYRNGLWIAPDLLRDYLDLWKGFFQRRPVAG